MSEGITGIIVLVIVNIAVAAYSYGRLSQKVNDLCRRMDRLEAIVNGRNPGKEEKGK